LEFASRPGDSLFELREAVQVFLAWLADQSVFELKYFDLLSENNKQPRIKFSPQCRASDPGRRASSSDLLAGAPFGVESTSSIDTFQSWRSIELPSYSKFIFVCLAFWRGDFGRFHLSTFVYIFQLFEHRQLDFLFHGIYRILRMNLADVHSEKNFVDISPIAVRAVELVRLDIRLHANVNLVLSVNVPTHVALQVWRGLESLVAELASSDDLLGTVDSEDVLSQRFLGDVTAAAEIAAKRFLPSVVVTQHMLLPEVARTESLAAGLKGNSEWMKKRNTPRAARPYFAFEFLLLVVDPRDVFLDPNLENHFPAHHAQHSSLISFHSISLV
jgi:hypothetical protein